MWSKLLLGIGIGAKKHIDHKVQQDEINRRSLPDEINGLIKEYDEATRDKFRFYRQKEEYFQVLKFIRDFLKLRQVINKEEIDLNIKHIESNVIKIEEISK